MEDKNSVLLFEYLRSILYDSEINRLDIDQLDEPFQKLGKGMQYLQEAVEEMLRYSADLSCGNLSGPYPSRENFLCVNLKNLHANMNHLTWQAKQVAAGDYSQHASYLGEFSEAFNTMIEQLRERENLLMKKAEMAENYNRLLIELTHSHQECIMVVDAHSGEIVYCNKSKNGDGEFAEGKCSTCCGCEQRLTIHDEILKWKDTEKKISRNDSDKYTVWEKEDSEGRIYQITTYAIEWKEKEVYVHIITDITESRKKGMILEDKAYRDPGTGLYNRRYFEEYMERALLKREQLTLCYIDIDGLKYVNDKYGHLEGDNYIAMIVAAIKNKAKYIRV
ncbi:MAG: diguanylate cyclase domain-containing protein [Bariatricus sp.]